MPETSSVITRSGASGSVLDAIDEAVGALNIVLQRAVVVVGDEDFTSGVAVESEAILECKAKFIGGLRVPIDLLVLAIVESGADVEIVVLRLGGGDALPVAYGVSPIFSPYNHGVDPFIV